MSEVFARYPSLAGRTVLVSGGATGIGASLVENFAAQGARVAFLDLDCEAAQTLVERIAATGAERPLFQRCDLRDIAALKTAVATVERSFGPVRALVNNAARDDRHALAEVTPEYFDDRIAVNLRHQFFAIQAVTDAMERAGGGSIVNMGSISWLLANEGYPVYATAKAAVSGLTRAVSRDLGRRNIRVNTVLPGWIMTERQISLWLTPEGEAEIMNRQCLKEKLYPDDVARLVLFLASDDSRMITNQSFVVDGGWT